MAIQQAKTLAGMCLKFAAQLSEATFHDSGVRMMADGIVDEIELTIADIRHGYPGAFDTQIDDHEPADQDPNECPLCETDVNSWDSCCPECGYELPGRC